MFMQISEGYYVEGFFNYTEIDKAFYDKYLGPRLPAEVYDVHVHMSLPEHTDMLPEERFLKDWALQCVNILTVDDAYRIAVEIFPGIAFRIAGFGWPILEADIKGNNKYLVKMRKAGKIDPFMVVRPEWEPEKVEKNLIDNGFVGFKPYPDMVTGEKGADVSIFTFFPHEQWEILNRNKLAVMLHLPRKGRFADDGNVRELDEARQKYPEVTIIIAHFGRSFCPYYLEEGLRKLNGAEGFYFDTAAVLNPEVYMVAFNKIPSEKILYGSDMPIPLMHGRRKWTDREYINFCREEYEWNKDKHESPEIERNYTLFLYEEIKAILDGIDNAGLSERQKRGVFRDNSMKALKLT
jgi:predicted TIM-barrel fold metal-dependent hydrolase